MKKVPHTLFSTEVVPETDRFSIWRESMSVLFEVEPDDLTARSEFGAQLEAYLIGGVMMAKTRSNAAHYLRKAKLARADGIDTIMIQLFLKGEVQFRSGKNVCHVREGDFVIFDLEREACLFNTDFENLSVLYPRWVIEQYVKEPSRWHGRVLPREQPMSQLLKAHVLSLFEFGPKITTDCAASLEKSLCELTGAALHASAANLDQAADAIELTMLMRIKSHIRDHLEDPSLSPVSIGAAFGLSRAALYRVTEPLGGITAYIREQRLRRCMKELQSPEFSHLSITELGYKWGFNDAGTFTRNFKRFFGMLPKDAREQAVRGHLFGLAPDGQSTGLDRNYEQWVRSIGE